MRTKCQTFGMRYQFLFNQFFLFDYKKTSGDTLLISYLNNMPLSLSLWFKPNSIQIDNYHTTLAVQGSLITINSIALTYSVVILFLLYIISGNILCMKYYCYGWQTLITR